MAKAIWKNKVIAESGSTIMVEGNHYFPKESVKKDYLRESNTHTVCAWKGIANYYSIEVDGQINKDAAWYYPNPNTAASNIKDYVAFWRGVEIIP